MNSAYHLDGNGNHDFSAATQKEICFIGEMVIWYTSWLSGKEYISQNIWKDPNKFLSSFLLMFRVLNVKKTRKISDRDSKCENPARESGG